MFSYTLAGDCSEHQQIGGSAPTMSKEKYCAYFGRKSFEFMMLDKTWQKSP